MPPTSLFIPRVHNPLSLCDLPFIRKWNKWNSEFTDQESSSGDQGVAGIGSLPRFWLRVRLMLLVAF